MSNTINLEWTDDQPFKEQAVRIQTDLIASGDYPEIDTLKTEAENSDGVFEIGSTVEDRVGWAEGDLLVVGFGNYAVEEGQPLLFCALVVETEPEDGKPKWVEVADLEEV